MTVVRLKWSSLLNIADLEFIPEPPKVLTVTDELLQTIAWLTGATGHDRRLLRCNDLGALLVGNAWDNLGSVEVDELYPQSGSPDTWTRTPDNKGVLIATSTEIIMIDFYRFANGDYERLYLPPGYLYFYPHKTYKVIIATVPYTGGTASYVGLTAYN